MEYLPLPTEFNKNTFNHRLVKETEFRKLPDKPFGSWRIYERFGLKSNNRVEEHKKASF